MQKRLKGNFQSGAWLESFPIRVCLLPWVADFTYFGVKKEVYK